MNLPLIPRLALLALLTVPLAACEGTGLPGFGIGEEPQIEGHKGPPTVSPLQAPIETGTGEARTIATAEAKTYHTTAFSARGNEPFWAVDVAGKTAIYKTPSNQRGQAIQVNRLTFAEGVEYIGVQGGRPFSVNIRAVECRDSMSGDRFPMTARLTVSGRSHNGCASPATAEVAAAVAATRAPAPAAPRAASRSTPSATRPAASPAAAAPDSPKPAADKAPAPVIPTPEVAPPATPAPASPKADSTTPGAPAVEKAPVTSPAVTVPAPAMTLPATPPAADSEAVPPASDGAE